MLVMFGYSSKIAEAVRNELDRGAHRDAAYRLENFQAAMMDEPPLDAGRYLFTAGVMVGKPVNEMRHDERLSILDVNFISVLGACEQILDANDNARICIIGSESGYSGSFDRVYAGSKSAIHGYVEQRRVGPLQQLVAISPGIIGDAGMTERRTDVDNLDKRRLSHPKKRFLTCAEVARLAVFLLYEDQGYLSNTVIRMNGGEHTR